MRDHRAWLPALNQRLDGEAIEQLLSGAFIDRPKSMRTGLLALTSTRVVFFRRKLLNQEFISAPASSIAEARIGAFAGVAATGGRIIPEVTIAFEDGTAWRFSMIAAGDPGEMVAAIQAVRTR